MHKEKIISLIFDYLEERLGHFAEQIEGAFEGGTLVVSFSGSRLISEYGLEGTYMTPPDPDKVKCSITLSSVITYDEEGRESQLHYDKQDIEGRLEKLLSIQ